MHIPFNKPYLAGKELEYIGQAHVHGQLAGDGPFTRKCHAWIEKTIGCPQALLTHSCTGALEMAALLLEIKPGDEMIMPSYTFVSTASAFVLRGGIPVFVDIRPDTLNLDENQIERAITAKTKAIVVVHYGGVACEMDRILEIARRHGLPVVEDAAQSIGARYRNRPLGSLGALGALSFHETKNIHSGEGGALLINEDRFFERAEIIRQKGTNRAQFLKNQTDKYTWVDVGSSFLPGELSAAFLLAQLEQMEVIQGRRTALWDNYHRAFEGLEKTGKLRRPRIPEECQSNGHLYYLLLPSLGERDRCLKWLNQNDVNAVFHYVPLHSSPAGRVYGRASGALTHTDELSSRLVRLPLWVGLEERQPEVIQKVLDFFRG